MLPYIIAGAVSAVGYLGYKLIRECDTCHRRLKWTHNCMCCDKVICGGCGIVVEELRVGGSLLRAEGIACPSACRIRATANDEQLEREYLAERARIAKRLDRISKVRLVSVNFGGTQNPEGYSIETGWYEEKHEAEEEARRIAVDAHDCDTVWYVKTISEKFRGVSENNRPYFYRKWKVTGEA